MMHARCLLRISVLVLCMSACAGDGTSDLANPSGDSGDTAVAACPSLTLVPGTGQFSFEPFDLKAGVEMVNGKQGGWHLWTAGQLCGVGPTIAVDPSVVEVAGGRNLCGSQKSDVPINVNLADNPAYGQYDADSRSGTFYNQLALLDDMFEDLPPGTATIDVICALAGAEVDFTIQVTDLESGATDSATTRLTMHLDPQNIPDCN
jgi:hypothetical protein